MGNPIIQIPGGWVDVLAGYCDESKTPDEMHSKVVSWIDRLIRDANKRGLQQIRDIEVCREDQLETEAARVIFQELLPKWSQEFIAKNSRYGETANLLGSKGQFADMWRKVGPLKRMLWDEEELIGESVEEVVRDLIGHCFLTLYYRQKEYEQAKRDYVEKIRAGARKKYQGENDLRPSGRDSLDDLVQHDMEGGK